MKKKILIIDDSALMRRLVYDIINADGRFQADDYCKDGKAGYETLLKTRYDAVILDVNMPIMSGLELLQKLKDDKIHVNIIMVSSTMNPGSDEVIKATQLGVFDYILKPSNFVEARGESFRNRIIDSLAKATNTDYALSAMESGVGTSVRDAKKSAFKELDSNTTTQGERVIIPRRPKERVAGSKLIALACSTGGPKALHSVIPFLPKNLDAPIVLVQHMPIGFTNLLAERLNKVSQVEVKEAEDGETIKNGHVYVAPGGFHMRVVPNGNTHKIKLSQEPPQGGLRPYANFMYESLRNSSYDEITCVVLTGMGADGTQGILHLKEKKNVYVIVQNKETSAVYGMPKAIVDAGLQDEIIPLSEVYQSITKNVGVR